MRIEKRKTCIICREAGKEKMRVIVSPRIGPYVYLPGDRDRGLINRSDGVGNLKTLERLGLAIVELARRNMEVSR